MAKSIIFRMWKFPGFCETFLLNQLIVADKCGLETKLLVQDAENLSNNPHTQLISEAGVREKMIYEDYGMPDNFPGMIFKAGVLLLSNPTKINSFFKFLKSRKSPGFKDVFRFYFLVGLNRFDIIHVQYGTNVKPLEVLKRTGVLKSKLLVSFHGHDLHFPINGIIYDQDYYNETFKYADLLTTTTGYLKNLLISLGAPEEKIGIIPVAVDTDFFYPEFSEENRGIVKIITVGRMDKLKGQRFGIELAQRLRDNDIPFQYTLVGSGSNEEQLRDLIREYELEGLVKMVGQKSQIEVRDLLQESDIFLMTSVTGPQKSREGQGLVTAEAQACGLPVVAFDSGGVKYTIEDGKTGFVVPEKDVEAMLVRLKLLIEEKSLRDRMGQNAVTYIHKNFSQRAIQEKWFHTYNNL